MAILRRIREQKNRQKKYTIPTPFSSPQVQEPDKKLEFFEEKTDSPPQRPKKRKKKGRGRPKLSVDERRTQKVVVTLTRSEEARLIKMARKSQFTKSEFMRRLLQAVMKK